MISRAYHDSLFMSRIAPTAMLFIPCRGGVSHRPDEYATPEAIAKGALVLGRNARGAFEMHRGPYRWRTISNYHALLSKFLLVLALAAFTMLAAAKSYDNVEFSHAGGSSLQFDASVPDGPGPYPASSSSTEAHGSPAIESAVLSRYLNLYRQAGFAWFSISYRLAKVIDPASIPEQHCILGRALGAAVDDVRKRSAL